MVIYVRVEPGEARDSRKTISEIKERVRKLQEKALAFDAVRNEKKRNSIGIITRTRALEEEIAKIKELLPKIETDKAKQTQIKPMKFARVKVKVQAKKKGYSEELEEIRKKIASLKG